MYQFNEHYQIVVVGFDYTIFGREKSVFSRPEERIEDSCWIEILVECCLIEIGLSTK